jgi:hydroxyacylglutathione hydrolase
MVERIVVGELNTNAYLFSIWKKSCLIIDPGGDAEEIINHMVMKNLHPLGIVCTHGHFDHVAAVGELHSYFAERGEDIPIFVHKLDSHFFGKEALNAHRESYAPLGPSALDLVNSAFNPLPAADVLLKEGDTILDSGLVVLHTPGHTPGSICLYSEVNQVLFTGDTLFFEGVGRSDLPGGDGIKLMKNIRKKILNLPDEVRVFPGHGPFSTIEREKNHNPYLELGN